MGVTKKSSSGSTGVRGAKGAHVGANVSGTMSPLTNQFLAAVDAAVRTPDIMYLNGCDLQGAYPTAVRSHPASYGRPHNIPSHAGEQGRAFNAMNGRGSRSSRGSKNRGGFNGDMSAYIRKDEIPCWNCKL